MPADGDTRIELLADHPECLEMLARWCHDEWGFIRPGDTIEARIERMQGRLGRDGIPAVYLALCGGTMVGSASLVAHDLDSRPDLGPWLASLYVPPESRRQGIGRHLVRHIARMAAGLNVPALYLYTFDKAEYYGRLGWSTVGEECVAGRNVTIMDIDARRTT